MSQVETLIKPAKIVDVEKRGNLKQSICSYLGLKPNYVETYFGARIFDGRETQIAEWIPIGIIMEPGHDPMAYPIRRDVQERIEAGWRIQTREEEYRRSEEFKNKQAQISREIEGKRLMSYGVGDPQVVVFSRRGDIEFNQRLLPIYRQMCGLANPKSVLPRSTTSFGGRVEKITSMRELRRMMAEETVRITNGFRDPKLKGLLETIMSGRVFESGDEVLGAVKDMLGKDFERYIKVL
jgi:hypothetical protein